jgi:hypothetical protein
VNLSAWDIRADTTHVDINACDLIDRLPTRSMQKSAAEIMKEQEALLMAKYGGAGGKFPMGKKKPGAPKVSEKVMMLSSSVMDLSLAG